MLVSSTDLAGAEHLVGVLVELEVGELEAADRALDAGAVAAQHDADAGHQLLDAEGLGDVVVAADGEAAHLLLGRVARGEEDDRHLDAVADEPLHQREAVLVGKADVEDDRARGGSP